MLVAFVSLASSVPSVRAQPPSDHAESPSEEATAEEVDSASDLDVRVLDPEREGGARDEREVVPPAYEDAPASAAERARAARREAERDSDGDGLPDALERATGTRALRADTDRDGVPDVRSDFRHGVIDRVTHIDKNTGRPLRIEYYQGGRITHTEVDTDRDGALDRRVTYSRIGEETFVEEIVAER